jgi:hypothetical protein
VAGSSYIPTTVNGAAIRVRRSSDDALQDVGMLANGQLDQAFLLNFIGGPNYITFSEDLTSSTWSKVGGTISANAQFAPNGSNTADVFLETTPSNEHFVDFNYTTPTTSTAYIFSAWVKPINHTNRQFVLRGVFVNGMHSSFIVMDLNTGTIVSNNGGLWSNTTITPAANGFYLIRGTYTTPSSIPTLNDLIFRLQHFEANPQANIYAGSTTVGTAIWGCQLQPGPNALGYTPTSNTAQFTVPDGFVQTWYDQSGSNRHLTQTNLSNQPLIVSQGVLQTSQNGKPTVVFQGNGGYVTSTFLTNASGSFSATNSTLNMVARWNSINGAGNSDMPFGIGVINDVRRGRNFLRSGNMQLAYNGNSNNIASTNLLVDTIGNHRIFSANQNGTALILSEDGIENNLILPATVLTPCVGIGMGQPNNPTSTADHLSSISISEGIVFPVSLTANESRILNCDQSIYYGINTNLPGLGIYVTTVPVTNSCQLASEQVYWNNSTLSKVTNTNGELVKTTTSVWDGGGASMNLVHDNGYLQFRAIETNRSRILGLNQTFTGVSNLNIQYGIWLQNNGLIGIYESGNLVGNNFGTYAANDTFKVAVESGVIKYYRNGRMFHTSTAASPTLPLLAVAALQDIGATASQVRIVNLTNGTFNAVALNAGSNAVYQWKRNGTNTATNTSTPPPFVTNANDSIRCELTLSDCATGIISSNTIQILNVSQNPSTEFYITSGSDTAGCKLAREQVRWKFTNLNNAARLITSGNNASKALTNAWDASALSNNLVHAGGYMEFTVPQNNRTVAVGLTPSYTGPSVNNIPYAVYLNNSGVLQVFESGVSRGVFGNYVANDVFRIGWVGNEIRYYKNQILFYTSTLAPTISMSVQAALYEIGAAANNVHVGNPSTGVFTAHVINGNGTYNFSWVLNGTIVQSGPSSTYTNTNLTSGNTLVCNLAYSGCFSGPLVSNTITIENKAPDPDLKLWITAIKNPNGCFKANEQVVWRHLGLENRERTQFNGNSVTKTTVAGWNAAAMSHNTIQNQGYVEFTATEINKSRIGGLQNGYAGNNYINVQYALNLRSNATIEIFESGVSRGSFGTYASGDTLRIGIENNVVRYYRNGYLLYSSPVPPPATMQFIAVLSDIGSTITNARVLNFTNGDFQVNSLNSGLPSYDWKLNNISTGVSSTTYSNTGLSTGDIIRCDMTLSGCLTNTIPSNTIAILDPLPPPSLGFHIQVNSNASGCLLGGEEVKWRINSQENAARLSVNANSLRKTTLAGWNAGSIGFNTVSNNSYLEFIASETNTNRVAGLSDLYYGTAISAVQYGIYLFNNATFAVYESGNNRGSFGNYASGDTFAVSLESNVIHYYKNGIKFYTSLVLPTGGLYPKAVLNEINATVTDAVIWKRTTGSYSAVVANGTPGYTLDWHLNNSSTGITTSNYTYNTAQPGDSIRCFLTPTGCLNQQIPSNKIRFRLLEPNRSIGFFIEGVFNQSGCALAVENVVWRFTRFNDEQRILRNGNSISKIFSAGWDMGAASYNTVKNGGYLQFTASETTTARMAGLSATYGGSGYGTIQFAFYLQAGGVLGIYESGANRGNFGTYAVGDVFRIQSEGGQVRYYKNGTLLYTSLVAPNMPMIAHASLNNIGSTITNAKIYNSNAGTFQAASFQSSLNPIYTWKLNGVTVQTGSSDTYTNTTLTQGDTITCVMNLNGCLSSFNYTSNIIEINNAPQQAPDFCILGNATNLNCSVAREDVKWKLSDLTANMSTSNGNTVEKISGAAAWNGGAASWNAVENNGFFEFTAVETNKLRMAGLSYNNTNALNTTIQFAIQLLADGTFAVIESGTSRGNFGPFNGGDVFKIAIVSNVVKYYRNDNLIYISTLIPILPLVVDVSIFDLNGTISNATVTNPNNGSFYSNIISAGTYRWELNGLVVQNSPSYTYTNNNLSNNDTIVCVLTTNLPGCSTQVVKSNKIIYQFIQPAGSEFYIQPANNGGQCYRSVEQVKWRSNSITNSAMNLTGFNDLVKVQYNANWNAGAASWNQVYNNGYFEFTAQETNKARAAGLSVNNSSGNFSSIQFNIYLLSNGTFNIYESGLNRGSFGSYTTGDVFRIAIENNLVRYYKNGVAFYTSQIIPTLPLIADASFYDVGATLRTPKISNYHDGTFTATPINSGASPSYVWKVNQNVVQTGLSNNYTNTGLNIGDTLSCLMTTSNTSCMPFQIGTDTIIIQASQPATFDLAIVSGTDSATCSRVTEPIQWKKSDLSNDMVITGPGGVRRITGAAWDGGAASWNMVHNNGYFEFTATEVNKARMIGLSTTNTGSGFTGIQFAIYLKSNAQYEIRQSGAQINVASPAFATGDVFRIAIDNQVVRYYKNGVMVYQSLITPSPPLIVDVSFYDGGGSIINAKVNNLSNGIFSATQVNGGLGGTYRWKLNGTQVASGVSSTYTNLNLTTGDQIQCEFISGLTGCSQVSLGSNIITSETIGQPGTDFAITANAVPFACAQAVENVKWKKVDLTPNTVVTGINNLQKTADNSQWNGGASSWNRVSNNGAFEFTALETDKTRMIGLSSTNLGSDQTSIRYGVMLENTGLFKIYESGTYRNISGNYLSGSVFRIAVEANVVKYYFNGLLQYTSTLAPTLPLIADVSIYEIGGTVGNPKILNYTNGVFSANVLGGGAQPIYEWSLNGATVQTSTSLTYTNTNLVSGDQLSCEIIPNLAGCINVAPIVSNTIYIGTSDPAQSEFHIKGVVNPTACNMLTESIQWKKSDLVNVAASTNNLIKTQSDGIWDGGAASWNAVALNGYFQFTTGENNKAKAAGLSITNTASSNTTIRHAFVMTALGELRIMESGTDRGISNTYAPGDLLRISIEVVTGVNRVRFYKNSLLLYTSTVAVTTLPMLADVSIYQIGGTIQNASISNLNSGEITASTVNMGTPTFQWLLNGTVVQTGSSATYINPSLTHNDQVTCVVTPGLNGCNNTQIISNLTVYNGPFLTITNPPPACTPSTVNLTLPTVTAGSPSDLVLTYWMDAAATIPLTNPTMATAGTYYIKGVRRSNCPADIKPVTVTINTAPAADITSTSGNQITCNSTSIQLDALGTGSYLWDNGSTASSRTVNSAGTYLMTVTGANGCTRQATYTVFQNTTPPVSFINGNTSPICQGATVTLQSVPTIYNNAIRFDGIAQYAELGDYFSYQDFSIEMWLRPGSVQTPSATIIDNNHIPGVRSWVVQQNASLTNQYQFTCFNTQGASATVSFTLAANSWQHVSLVKSPSALTVFINGNQTATTPWSLGAIAYDGSQQLRLGKWGGGTRFWNGQMDEVRFFNKDISAARISADMTSWYVQNTTNLISVYKMDEPDNSLIIANATNYVAGNGTVYGGANFLTSGIPLSSSFTYAWNPSGNTSSSISFIPTGTIVYSALVTGTNGCTKLDTTEISVSLNGVATVTAVTPGCQNTIPGTITITGSGAIAPYTFYYTLNGVPTSSTTPINSSSITIPVPNTTAGTYLYDINNLTYANASFCLQSQTAQASVTVNPEPLITAVTPGFICGSGTANISASSTSSVNWFTTPSGGTAIFSGSTYTTPILTSSTTYYVSAQSTQGCTTSTRTPVDVDVEYPGMWLGYSSDWDTPFNWGCSQLPTATTDVTIPTSPIGNFFPMVNSSGISVCRNLSIDPGASVTISNLRSLSIYGNINNNGSSNWGTGEMRFMAANQQQISSASAQTIGKIHVNNSTPYNAVKLNTDLMVQQQATFVDGVIDLNGKTLTVGTNTTNGLLTGFGLQSYVNSNGGFLKININTNSSYTFPVGDSLYYTPYSITFNSGAVVGSDIRVKVVDAPQPNLSPTIDKITRYWTVEPTGLLSNKNYDAFYTYAGSFEIIGAGPLFPVKYSTTSTQTGWNGSPGSLVTAITGTSGSHNASNFTLEWFGLTDFSDFTAAGNNVPLPVELLSFDAKQQGKDVLVSWITASELNNDRFEVERSQDGIDFTWIGTRVGNGTTSIMHSYSLLDNEPKNGINYYRLRQIDLDGSEKTTDPVAVVFRNEQSPISLFHDAALGSIVIQATNEDGSARFTLFDASGKVAFKYETTIPENWNSVIKLPDLSKGVYLIRCEVNGFSSNLKIVIP